MAGVAFSKRHLLAPVVLFLLLWNCLTEALVLEEEFSGKVVTDLKVDLPADQVWALYRKPDFYTILSPFVGGYYQKLDYVTGRGGVGSIVNITLTPVFGGSNYLFKVVEINDETRTRVERHLRGERFDSGFTSFETGYAVLKKTTNSCIIRGTTSFQIQQKSLSNATRLELNWFISLAVALYVNQKPVVLNEEYSGSVGTEMKVNLPAKDIWNVIWILDLQRMKLYYLDIIWRQRQVQGYYLDSGLTTYETVYRTIPKARNSCVISADRPFKVITGSEPNASAIVVPSWTAAITIANYVNSMKVIGPKKM